jgi:hypothetical protein
MPCKGKCAKEKPIKGSYKDNSANSKCSMCGIRYYSDARRCYCCNSLLRKRRSRHHSLRLKEEANLITRY